MNVLITGADGLLGSNVVRELLQQNHQVKAFILPGSTSKTLDGLPIEIVEGNILNTAAIEAAVEGCDAIIHAAANTNIWPNRSEIICKVNLEGTKNIVEAGMKAGIKRLVHIGTANSFGFGPLDDPGSEEKPFGAAHYELDYMDSKLDAQRYILQKVKDENLPAVIINPTFMLGPYDSKPSAGAMILAVYHKQVPGFAKGGKNYVAVKDAATAIVNALTKGRVGECYIVGHQNLNYKEAFTTIADVVGVDPPKITFPSSLIRLYGRMGSLYGNITKKAPTVSYTMACISCDEHYFSPQKAIDELGLPQTDIRVAIKEAFDWFEENGYLEN